MIDDVEEMLAARAESLEPPRFDPQVVLASGERLVVRRRRRVAAAVAGGLAIVVAAVALTVPTGRERVSPAVPSDPALTTEPGARPLGYGTGRVLHLGPVQIDTGLDFVAIDLTDDGAALVTLDGAVWFSDGTGVERVGTTSGASAIHDDGVSLDAGAPQEWVVSDSAGSLLAWVDPTDDGPTLSVYDTRERRLVLQEQVPVHRPRDRTVVVGLAGAEAFVLQSQPGRAGRSSRWLRFAVDGGEPAEVDSTAYDAALRGTRRALVLASTGEVLGVSDGMTRHVMDFDAIEVRRQRIVGAVDPVSGEIVELSLPDGDPVFEVVFWQWLDDDQFAVWANGDLMACQLSTGSCRRVLDENWEIGRRDTPLMPGDEGIGADWALARAMQAASLSG